MRGAGVADGTDCPELPGTGKDAAVMLFGEAIAVLAVTDGWVGRNDSTGAGACGVVGRPTDGDFTGGGSVPDADAARVVAPGS